MNVPNHEKKPFSDMTKEERSTIVEEITNGNVEHWNVNYWCSYKAGAIFWGSIYRTKPRQLIIPWEVIKTEYKWAAMDADGEVYVFTENPSLYNYCFNGCGAERVCALNIDTTGVEWSESLVLRPDGV